MKLITALAALPLGVALVAGSTAVAQPPQVPDGAALAAALPADLVKKQGVYIVRMADSPVAAYQGGVQGLRATKPGKNRKLNPRDPAVVAYADYLAARQNEAIVRVGAKKLYSYKYSYNGFAAELTSGQAQALRNLPGVISVTPDTLLQPDTITTSDMLQLEAGLWSELGGVENAGEGIIVGIIDSGVWPESASFSDRSGVNKNGKGGKLDYRQIPGWHGKCTPGDEFPASKCNQKLIGAQWFNAGFGGDAGVRAQFPYEYASARDADGHGTHTASTAAGNANVPVSIAGNDMGFASGMAPRARVSVYKTCWGRGGEGGCFSSDSVAAIDQAVIDGVDVINFSISGSRTSFLDQVEVAFLFAADAGVFVAASAGNSGPTASTVAHNSPWLTTVAAGTHDRGFEPAFVTTGEGQKYLGITSGSGTNLLPLVFAGDVTLAGADPTEGVLCYPGTLEPAKVEGRIVLCDRGDIARVEKSRAVSLAGGLGMVLANTSAGQSLNADFHVVPSIHVNDTNGAALRAYIASAQDPLASIDASVPAIVEASEVAGFSSRGPALAGSGDILKPDIMAPGVDVIAAVSPAGYNGNTFDALSGTSMSSPHMAGLGALMKQRYPDWSPAAIKSAFMTTATQKTNDGNFIAGGPFDYGAGFVVPNRAANPGLVYDAGFTDWLGFLCGTGDVSAPYCASLGKDPSDLNYPSIAIGSLVGSQTVTRTVTNVGEAGTYEVEVWDLDGIDVTVEPASLILGKGGQGTYTVTLRNVTAPLKAYANGAIVWNDGNGNSVRSPVVARPVEIDVPAAVSGAGIFGSLSFDVAFGYTGEYSVRPLGLQAATEIPGNVVDDPANDINTALGSGVGVTFHSVKVEAGAALQRIALFDDYTDGNDDLDLYVFNGETFAFVGSSGSGTSAEQVDIINPTASTYLVVVHGWETDGPDANYTLFSWSVATDEGNMTVTAPDSAVSGTSGSVIVDWTDLGQLSKYLGVLSHQNAEGEIARTVISVDTD